MFCSSFPSFAPTFASCVNLVVDLSTLSQLLPTVSILLFLVFLCILFYGQLRDSRHVTTPTTFGPAAPCSNTPHTYFCARCLHIFEIRNSKRQQRKLQLLCRLVRRAIIHTRIFPILPLLRLPESSRRSRNSTTTHQQQPKCQPSTNMAARPLQQRRLHSRLGRAKLEQSRRTRVPNTNVQFLRQHLARPRRQLHVPFPPHSSHRRPPEFRRDRKPTEEPHARQHAHVRPGHGCQRRSRRFLHFLRRLERIRH